jgi:RNA polymerase sigma-70 factor (ECF subfamily)
VTFSVKCGLVTQEIAMEAFLSATPTRLDTSRDALRIDHAMTRYAGGDSAAFTELFSMLEPKLRKHLRSLCHSEELARELTQETFLRIHRARHSFGHGRAALPWAHAIARNCYRSHTRAWSSRLWRASVDADDCPLQAGISHDTEARAIARETEQMLERVLAKLPEGHRRVAYLRAQGLSVGAVARNLGVSEGAVKLRSFRTYGTLRRALRRAESPAGRSSAGA